MKAAGLLALTIPKSISLAVGITDKKVNFILDADVRSFFDEVSQPWLIRFVEHRVGDPRLIRLIQKWLKAGVLEDGVVTVSEKGTGQGSVLAPRTQKITFGACGCGVYAAVRRTTAIV